MEKLKQIMARTGPVGWVMAILATAYFLLLVINIILGDGIHFFFSQLILPTNAAVWLKQPWSVLTFWFANHPHELWALFADLAILYSFGTVFQREIGRKRFVWMLLLFGAVAVLASLANAIFLPIANSNPIAQVHGMQAINAGIIAACLIIAPNHPFRFFTLEIKLLWVGLVILALSLLGTRAMFTPQGVAVLVTVLSGLGYGLWMEKFGQRQAWDVRMRQQASELIAKNRVRVRETPANAQHKGKFTIVHSTAKLQPEEELNRLLDRINEVGYNSLTSSEKKRLEELSGH